jgi:hypothetical protein
LFGSVLRSDKSIPKLKEELMVAARMYNDVIKSANDHQTRYAVLIAVLIGCCSDGRLILSFACCVSCFHEFQLLQC